MENYYERHRDVSAGVGPSRRPKRPRTQMTGYDPREDSPGLGPSSATSGSSRARTAPLASGSANSVVVPGSVILPNSDSQGRRTVIDLTDDSPPRRQPEVIDVDALPDRPSSYFYDGHDASRTQNEDLTMLMARRLFPRPTGHSPRPPAPRPVEPDPNAFNNRNYMRYHQEIAHPILGPGSRMGQELGPAGANRGGFGRNFLQMFEGIGHMWGAFGAANHGMMIRRESVDVSFHPPAGLDYRLGANGILHDTPPVEDAARRREEQYKAPLPARAGFTRSPTSEDVLVCPICEHELGTMSEVEGQNKIWLGKCGHIYCGKCAATFRAIPRSKKGRAKNVGLCEVEGCKVSLKGKGLWEIYL